MTGGINWVSYVDTFVDPDGSEFSQAASFVAITKLLLEESITIQDVVTAIGKYLTATDNSIRARGILLLGELLIKLASTPLEDTTIRSLSHFFAARLGDWHCLRGALIGSLALLRRSPQVGAVEGSDVKLIAKSVLENLHVQALALNDRLLSLELFECLVTLHGLYIATMGGDLVYGVCAAIEEEKDPRCLIVAFRLVENLARLFPEPDGPLADCAEDLFDIVSRYFPVSFTPPPNDTRGISRDDLAEALLRVFTSTPMFAPFCIPVLLEKLSSTLRRAKLDSLRYLGFCAQSFGPQSLSEHAGAIWLALKAELIPPSVQASAVSTDSDQKDAKVQAEAVSCLTRCVEAFQRSLDETGCGVTEALVKLICEDECVEDLVSFVENDRARVSKDETVSDHNYFNEGAEPVPVRNSFSRRTNEQTLAIGSLLAAAVKASPSSCYAVTNTVLTRLISAAGIPSISAETLTTEEMATTDNAHFLYKNPLSVTGLEVVVQILEGASSIAAKMASEPLLRTMPVDRKWLEPVRSVAPTLLMTFSQVIKGHVLMNRAQLGVAGLQVLASFPVAVSPLSQEQLQRALKLLVEALQDQTHASNLRDTALGAIIAVSDLEGRLRPLSEKRESNILNVVIPKLMQAVQEAKTTESQKIHLQTLAAIASQREITRQEVLTGLRDVLQTEFVQTTVETSHDDGLQKLVLILNCLAQDIIPCCEQGSDDQKVACVIVLDIWSGIQSLHKTTLTVSEQVLSSIMAVNRATVRSCLEVAQEQILAKAISVLLDSEILTLAKHPGMQELERDWTLYRTTDLIEDKVWLVALVGSVVVGLRPGTVTCRHNMLLKVLVTSSISEAGPLVTSVAAQASASLLNKWKGTSSGGQEGDGDNLDEALREAIDNTLMPVINHYQRATSIGANESVYCTFDRKKVVRGVYALAWIGKGLAMRGHSRVSDIAAALLMVLQSEATKAEQLVSTSDKNQGPSVANAAAESLGIFVKDNPTCLDKAHNSIIRPLYKQRIFTSMLPPILEAVRIAGNLPYRIWFFRAFGYLLSGTPHGALLTEGQKVFPLVLEGLSTLCSFSEDSDLLVSTLLALSSFLTDENNGRRIAAEHVPAVVRRLVTLVKYRSSSVIRKTALQCLATLVGLQFALIFPVKPQVMKAITAALDDQKRSVRKEAVQCRRIWAAVS